MSKVTIIVPIYNVEEYVAKCLDSLLRQTYSDYVIYAVNDGSPKNEQPIIDRYAAAYPEKVVESSPSARKTAAMVPFWKWQSHGWIRNISSSAIRTIT